VGKGALSTFVESLTRYTETLDTTELFGESMTPLDAVDARFEDPWFTKWFQPNVLKDLIRIHKRICDEDEDELRNIGLVAFSDILRRSSNAHQGYPNVMFDKRCGERPRPSRLFPKALKEVADAVAKLPANLSSKDVSVIEGDASSLELGDESVDAVITHPPYVGSIPYAEYGALSLRWLGHDPKQLDKRLTGGARQSRHVLTRFTEDYRRMISESRRILKPEGHLFVLVGNPTIRGELVDLAEMTSDHAKAAGFHEVARAKRTGKNRRANKMGDETLLVFRAS
jgi:site-specific DNA-methyltransferase (cytosine-N4-specific)